MPADNERFSLYLHIPYCISKCPYCDFNSHVVRDIPEKSYTEALIQELNHYAAMDHWRGRTVQTIFFGGGTPSTFQPSSIGLVLESVNAMFDVDPGCEITLEANPGTIDAGNFSGYRAVGVNRISVGVQSFNSRLLKFLGRAHSGEEAENALHAVKDAGFENFNLDLIYANPGQSLHDLEADLDIALSLQSPHFSAYNLTVEEGTPFHHEYRCGKLQLLGEEEEIAMVDLIEQKLGAAGLRRYEISNYARPGFHSRHNLNYWRSGDYLGIGAGAHSYQTGFTDGIYGRRWWNEKSPVGYMNRIKESGQAVTDTEHSALAKAAGEYMFCGLRLTEGVSRRAFAARFGENLEQLYPAIGGWVGDGLMETDGDNLRLTRRGLLVANSIFIHFI